MNSNPLAAVFLFLRAQPSPHRTAALPAVLAVWTFSLPGGGAEALTRSVSLCSRCLSASGSPEPPPRPTGRPERRLREDSPPPTAIPPPLFNSLSIPPSPNFFFLRWLPGISSTQPVHLSKQGSSLCSRADVSVRGEGGVLPPRRAHSFVSYYTSAGAVAVAVHQPPLLPPPKNPTCPHPTPTPVCL